MLKTILKSLGEIYSEIRVFALAGVLTLGIALARVSYQSIKAALANPIKSLRTE